jgi:eukaryotic-like serine/threonine-protein kinase
LSVIGTTVGHYEILEKLGEGGMGVVYKARDVLLNRIAALKFLPADGADADKRRRFVQEARAASALNHPNIVTIYEVGNAGDRDFIAMELIQGKPLDEMIGRKGLPFDRAIDVASQIAGALAAAHAAGIVHRDLKPGNVVVADSGLVKVLDFGLAKLMPGPSSVSGATQTMLSPRTVEGTIFGTVAYMSPEQAEGRPVDHRSDIFSFGALFHEMLTGQRTFQGESTASTLAAILTAEPASLPVEVPGLPADLVRIISRCLRKQPEKRWQSIADVRIALEELKQDLEAGRLGGPAAPAPVVQRGWMPIVAASLAAAVLSGFVVWRARPETPAPELWQIRRLTSDSGASLFPAISPDGKLVTYVSDRAASDTMDLWVQQIEGGDPVQLTRGLGTCRDATFSPDGTKIAAHCGSEPGAIYVVPTLGGLPKRLADGDWPRFSPDGSQIAYVSSLFGATGTAPSIWIVPAGSGKGTELKPGKTFNTEPVWRPDGKGLFIVGFGDPQGTQARFDWYFVPADGGPLTTVGAGERLRAVDFGPGRNLSVTRGGVLFSHGSVDSTNIYRMPFDAAFQQVSGNPVPVVVGSGFNFSPSASADGSRIAFAVGNNLSNNIWRAAVDSANGAVTGSPIRVTNGISPSLVPSPSRDGRRVAYLGGSRQSPEIRIRDLSSGTDARLAEAKDWSYLVLSPDGSTVAFSAELRIGSAIYTVPTTGGVPTKICGTCGRPVEWLSDRTKLLIDNAGPKQRDIQILDVATGQIKPLLHHDEFQLTMPRLSPDGKVLSFTQVRPGRARRILLAPFSEEPIPEQAWTVVIEGTDFERQPVWAPAGSTIYFLSERDGARCIWAQRVDTATKRPVGAPFAAHHMHEARYNLADMDPASIGLSLAGGQMFYATFDLQSNIWLAERR